MLTFPFINGIVSLECYAYRSVREDVKTAVVGGDARSDSGEVSWQKMQCDTETWHTIESYKEAQRARNKYN